MALGIPSLTIAGAAPDYAQHMTTDINDALGRLANATNDANADLDASITSVADDVTALTATVATLTSTVGWRLITTQTASASATVDFTTGIDSTYDVYMVDFLNVAPGTNAVDMYIRISTDGGATFKAGVADYSSHFINVTDAPASVAVGSAAASAAMIGTLLTSAANCVTSGLVYLFQPSAARLNTHQFKTSYTASTAAVASANGAFRYNTASAINGIRFLMSSGSIASGTFTLYGLTK